MSKRKSLKPLILLNIGLFITVLGLAVYAFGGFSSDETPSHIPAFGMESLDGGSFGSADMTDPLMLVNIFASWCMPCHAEHPVLMDVKERTGIPIYGIALKDTPENIRTYLDKNGNPYTAIGLDNAGLLPAALGQSGIPITVLIDGDRAIKWIWTGPITPRLAESDLLPFIEETSPGS